MSESSTRHGTLAEFSTPEELLKAAEAARTEGYQKMDAYSPFPIHGLDDALGMKPTKLPWLVFAGGCVGAVAGYALQYFVSVVDYPLNIGGRPLNSVPAFIPVTFECTILFAAFTAGLAMLALNGFPRPNHPVFSVEAFKGASKDKFFLCLEAADPKFDQDGTKKFLQGLKADNVYDVES